MAIEVRRSASTAADVVLRDPETGPRAHRELLDAGLDAGLLDALRELPGESAAAYRRTLLEYGADAIEGAWADAAAKAAVALDYAAEHGLEVGPDGFADVDDAPADEPIATAIETARAIGHGGTPLNLPSSRADLATGTPPIFAAAPSTTPQVAVELSGEWFGRDREQREDVLELLVGLATGVDVELRPTTVAARKLHEQHRAELPAHVTERVNPRRGTPPSHAASEPSDVPERVHERLADARAAVDPDGAAAALLRALRDTQGQHLTYADVRRELRLSDSHPRVLASRLADLGLAERLEREDGRTVVSLLPLGQRLLEEWRATVGEQAALPASDGDDSPVSTGALRTPQNLTTMPCKPAQAREAPQAGDAAAAAEAADATDGDRTDRYAQGAVALGWMDRARHDAVVGAARSGELSLVDAELETMLEACGDGREPAWSFDPSSSTLVVGAEYHNQMQWWIAIARALSAPRTWQRVFGADRVGEHLEKLSTDDVDLLRDTRCIGWLPDEAAEDREALVDELGDAYEELLELSARLRAGDYEDENSFRGTVLQYAHGLAGTMSHLLELAGVDVVREVRIPEFTQKFTKGGHEDRREGLCKTVAIGAAIASSYGHFAAYRQLLEDRQTKVKQALQPRVDANDPLAELHGSFVIAGRGVDGLEEELREALERPKALREDAPEFAARFPVRVADGRATTRRVVTAVASRKELDVPREAIAALHGFTRSAYATADAVETLGSEAMPRNLYLDEVRYALGSLDDAQLLPDAPRSARAGLIALLRAEEPISQAELARRAGICTQSWRNHREALQAAGLVDDTPEGWRCTLPFKSERYEEDALEDVAEPWILDPATDRLPGGAEHRTVVDVLEELGAQLGELANPVVDDALRWPVDEGPPPGEALEAIDAAILTRFVEGHVPDRGEPEPPAALLGPELEQASLQTLRNPQKSTNGA